MMGMLEPRRWVERHADYLYAYALSRLDEIEMSRDLVQETFLAALERVGEFGGKSSERTWLTAILKYKLIDVYRSRASGSKGDPGRGEEIDFFEADSGHWKAEYGPKAIGIEYRDPLLQKELRSVLQRCMQKLPALWLSIFTLKHVDEEPTEFICTTLKVTPANFWVIMHRAKVNLRACMQKNWL
jgi:RNA polymerase sigma-70 factor (TIGR02943 family)